MTAGAPTRAGFVEASPRDQVALCCPACGLQFGATLPRHDVKITCRCGHAILILYRDQPKPMS